VPASVVKEQENSVCTLCMRLSVERLLLNHYHARFAAVSLFLQVRVNHGTTLPIEQLASADIPQSACETYPPLPQSKETLETMSALNGTISRTMRS
jgi:hypothetical protein